MREMKDSGVEWIGKIPKDWEIVPLTKQLDSIVDYRGKTPEKTEEGTFLVTAKNIKDGKICYELSKEYVREADYEEIMHRGIPQIGDILFTTEAPLGQVANVDRTDIALAQRIIKFRASFVEYIAFVLGDDYVASMLEGKQMGESGFFANSSDAMPALYEKMLKTSVEGPERIKDIGYVLKMVTDKDIIPDEFRELYETFCNTLKIRR